MTASVGLRKTPQATTLGMRASFAGAQLWRDGQRKAGERFQSDKMYKAAFKAARNVRKSLGLQQMPWAPPSQVNSIVARTRTVYSEIGFLSESELTKICGVGSKALKLSPGKIFLEDKSATLTGFYVSLLDMPAAMVNGVRKIRLEWSTTTEHVAIRLHPDRQIMQDQGQAVFNFCTDQRPWRKWAAA